MTWNGTSVADMPPVRWSCEPISTWTNVAFVVAGVVLSCHKSARHGHHVPWLGAVVGAGLVGVGVASFLKHAWADTVLVFNYMDRLSMMIVASIGTIGALSIVRRDLTQHRALDYIAAAVQCVLALLPLALRPATELFDVPFELVFALAAAPAWIIGGVLAYQRGPCTQGSPHCFRWRALVWCSFFPAVVAVLVNLVPPAIGCSSVPRAVARWSHGLWHVLIAVASVVLVLVLQRVAPLRARAW